MVELVVKSNIRRFSRLLTRYQKRQLPFAVSQALNATAFEGRGAGIKAFDRDFDLRNKGFARGILRVDKATKRDLSAAVFDRRELDYLVTQQDGGVKRPRSGQHIAVPRQARRTARGVAKADRPRQIIASGKGFATRRAIFRKVGRGGRQLKLMHSLIRQARIRPRLKFDRDIERLALRRFDRHFQRWLIKALRTAR